MMVFMEITKELDLISSELSLSEMTKETHDVLLDYVPNFPKE